MTYANYLVQVGCYFKYTDPMLCALSLFTVCKILPIEKPFCIAVQLRLLRNIKMSCLG